MSLRLIFMGTPAFSVPTLERLVADEHDVACVYTQPPRPAGRGMADRPSPVHEFAASHGIDVRTPVSLKVANDQAAFAALNADVAVVVAYGLLLPVAVLQAPRHGCLNVHASLLPRWRGAAPIQRAIMTGDKQSGVSIMQMEEGLDTGPVVSETRVPITNATTADALHDKLASVGAGAMSTVLARLETDGRLEAAPQPEAGVTYAQKISKAEARLDFNRDVHAVLRHIHGLSPFPGAWCLVPAGDRLVRVKLLQAEAAEGLHGSPGTVLDARMAIACANGAIRPVRLQREGKGPMDLDAFLNGLKPEPGSMVE